MNYWFECKVGYDRATDRGSVKKVTEVYLVDALSFTEAEERVVKEVGKFTSMGDLEVLNIKRVKISELFLTHRPEADKYYKAKVLFISFDEKTSTEKKNPANIIVKSEGLSEAVSEIISQLNRQTGDYEIFSVTETLIMDIFSYEFKS